MALEPPEAQAEVAAAIVRAEAPVLTIEAIEGEALTKLVGPMTAREMDPAWLLLRGTLKTRAKEFPYARFQFVLGRSDREVPQFEPDREHLAAFTKEKLPKGFTYSRYGSPLCDNILTCLLFFPAVPFTLEKRGEAYAHPTDDDYRRSAPRRQARRQARRSMR